MATKNDGVSLNYILQWKIENISQAWWLENEHIRSPTFIVDELKGTKWSLGLMFQEENEINFYLHREEDCSGPPSVKVEYELAFLGRNGLIFKDEILESNFETNTYSEIIFLTMQNGVFDKGREINLPEDTLTVQCTLQTTENEGIVGHVESRYLYAQTVLKVIRKSFDWKIENFSNIQLGVIKKFKDDLIEFHLLFLLNEDSGKVLRMNINPFQDCIKYISCKTSTINSEGKKESWEIDKCIFGNDFQDEKQQLSSVVQFQTEFLENKNRNFPNDVLSLYFEIVLSTVEHSHWKTYSAKGVQQQNDENIATLIEDLKFLYNNPSSSDINLSVSEKIFPVHKAVLIARSPVFRRMFSHDMKEMNNGEVVIEDLDSDTVQRMLLFMYTSTLEGMTYESASKLYLAADKYDIASLKSTCSSFLKHVLSSSTVLPTLFLAEQHQDDDLKNAVYVYISQHVRCLVD